MGDPLQLQLAARQLGRVCTRNLLGWLRNNKHIIYIYMYIHSYTYIYIYIYIDTCISLSLSIYIYIYTYMRLSCLWWPTSFHEVRRHQQRRR